MREKPERIAPLHPGRLVLCRDDALPPAVRVNGAYPERVLRTIHPLDPEGSAVGDPEWGSEILVCLPVEISPHHGTSGCRNNANADFGIVIAGLRIPGGF